MDYTVHGILQARILEWVAIPFSRIHPHISIHMILQLNKTWEIYPVALTDAFFVPDTVLVAGDAHREKISFLPSRTQPSVRVRKTVITHLGDSYMCACSVAWPCPTLCDPGDYSPPGSSVHGVSQARILEWVAISYSRGSSQPRDQTHISCVSCTERRFLYHCTAWEAHEEW